MAQFGQQLKELRLKTGVSSQKSASYLGTPTSAIHNFESGRSLPSKYQTFQLASCFNVDAKQLLVAYQKQRIRNEEISEKGEVKSCIVKNKEVASERYHHMVRELQNLNRGNLRIIVPKPATPLDRYIENITFYDGHNFDCSSRKIMPDGTIKLFIELDGNKRQLILGNDDPTSGYVVKNIWVTGIQKQHMVYQLEPRQTILSMQFRPDGFHALTGIPQAGMESRDGEPGCGWRGNIRTDDCPIAKRALRGRRNA